MGTSIALLAAKGALNGWWTAAAIGFAGYTATTTAIVVVGSRCRDLVNRGMQRAAQLVARLRRRPATNAATAVDDLADALAAARRNPRWARRAVFHTPSDKALGAAMLLCAVTAVGQRLGPTYVIVIYAAALATSMAPWSRPVWAQSKHRPAPYSWRPAPHSAVPLWPLAASGYSTSGSRSWSEHSRPGPCGQRSKPKSSQCWPSFLLSRASWVNRSEIRLRPNAEQSQVPRARRRRSIFIRKMERRSSRETCIWLTPMRSAISDWVKPDT